MEQEHRITYKAGITRTPSDFLCEDGTLAECINLATDNEELKPMVQPAEFMTVGFPTGAVLGESEMRLFYVHKINDISRYIFGYRQTTTDTKWTFYWTLDGSTLNPIQLSGNTTLQLSVASAKITSVNETLVASDDDSMVYFLWKQTDYKHLDYPLPDIELDAKMIVTSNQLVSNSGIDDDILGGDYVYEGGYNVLKLKFEEREGEDHIKQEEYNDLVVGLYKENEKAIQENKWFLEPFYIRAALEMYDGSYTMITNPILLFPSVKDNTYAYSHKRLIVETQGAKLLIKQTQDYKDYEDLIKDVVIFATRGVKLYDTTVDQPLDFLGINVSAYLSDMHYSSPLYIANNVSAPTDSDKSLYRDVEAPVPYEWRGPSSERIKWYDGIYRCLKRRAEDDVRRDLESQSLFYKLCSIGRGAINDYIDIGTKMRDHVLDNLVNQERLEIDDYYSRCKLQPKFLYPYNSRLNISNVKRGFFEGFSFFTPLDCNNSTARSYIALVKIETSAGDYWVCHRYIQKNIQKLYFYYPDSRAKHVYIGRFNHDLVYDLILDNDLKEHPGLNGAYSLLALPYADYNDPATAETSIGTITTHQDSTEVNVEPTLGSRVTLYYNNDAVEYLPNYLITSEVNNPFVFNAEGYNKIGTGKIIAMSTITQALSQGQFGQFPLLVFSESGIWALSVDNTGLYQSIYPMSRDVCLNPRSILQTDGAVFFVSKKGLMIVVGNEVRCVSEHINGLSFPTNFLSPLADDTDWQAMVEQCEDDTSFLQFIQDPEWCFMAYDYIDSRVIIFNSNPDQSKGYNFQYAYNIADGTFSKTIVPGHITNAVNNYPDYLLYGIVFETNNNTVIPRNKVFSFYEKDREDEVTDRQLCFLVTRPMKLAGPVSQASLRQLMNVGTWDPGTDQNPGSCVKTDIYVSSDMRTWYNDISRFGAAARYYRIALFIKMLPTERLSGTILTTQERRGNNMR